MKTPTLAPALDPEAVRLGATIRELRIARGLTQAELADAAGISRPYLAHQEAGRKMASRRTIYKLAAALNVSQASLIAPVRAA